MYTTTTPCKGSEVEDPVGSTAMCRVWGDITPAEKDKAFELWTSPANIKTPTILKLLALDRDENVRSDRQTSRCLVEENTEFPTDTAVTSVNEAGTTRTDKPFTLLDDNCVTTAGSSEVRGDVMPDVKTTTPPPRPDANNWMPEGMDDQSLGMEDDISHNLPHTQYTMKNPTPQGIKKGITDGNVNPPHPPKADDSFKSSSGDTMTPGGQGGTMARLGVGTGGAAGGSSTRGCTYKKGVCHIHGEGAIKKWKPSFITEVGPDGKKTRRYAKKYEYVCDTSLNGRKLYQSRLSFPSMTVNARGGVPLTL